MKKRMVIALALAGVLCVPSMVSAGTTLTQIGTVGYARWIYNTNLLRVEGSDGYGVQKADGTMITECKYGSFDSYYGYIILNEYEEGLEYAGVIDKEGNQLVPCDYAEIKILNQNWILGINLEEATADQYDYESWLSSDTYYKITKVDIYSVVDGAATCVASLARENYMDAEAAGPYINIQDRATSVISSYDAAFEQVATDLSYISDAPVNILDYEIYKENGRKGIKDLEGNIILEPSFEYIYDYRYGYAEVESDGKDGLVDKEGNVVVPAEYDKVYSTYYAPYDEETNRTNTYNALGYYTVCLDGKIGYVTSGGEVTSEPKYSKDVFESKGVSGTVDDLTGNKILVAADGVETVLEGYDRINPLDGSYGVYYKVSNADGMEGVIDWHGEEILPCEYEDVSMSYDGNYILVNVDYDNYEIYQVTTELGGNAAEESTEAAVEEADSTETADDAAVEEIVAEESTENADEAVVEDAESTESAEDAVVDDTEAAEDAAASENSAVITLIDSAKATLASDTPENRVAAATIFNSAAAMLGEDQAAVAVIISSAVTQLQTEGSDLNVVLTLIDSAVNML